SHARSRGEDHPRVLAGGDDRVGAVVRAVRAHQNLEAVRGIVQGEAVLELLADHLLLVPGREEEADLRQALPRERAPLAASADVAEVVQGAPNRARGDEEQGIKKIRVRESERRDPEDEFRHGPPAPYDAPAPPGAQRGPAASASPRRASTRAGPMPRTRARSSRDVKGPRRSLSSTMRRASPGPMPGKACSSSRVAS